MEKARIEEKRVNLLKVELNGAGDYVTVSADDPTLFDRFAAGFKRIFESADSIPEKLKEIEKRYEGNEEFSAVMDKTVAMSKVNVEFSEEAIKTIDGIFGDGTVKKYFAAIYGEIPDFLPDADCITDFFEQITPVMESLFNKKIERQKEASRARMAKYQPQDHKKSGKKAYAKAGTVVYGITEDKS